MYLCVKSLSCFGVCLRMQILKNDFGICLAWYEVPELFGVTFRRDAFVLFGKISLPGLISDSFRVVRLIGVLVIWTVRQSRAWAMWSLEH